MYGHRYPNNDNPGRAAIGAEESLMGRDFNQLYRDAWNCLQMRHGAAPRNMHAEKAVAEFRSKDLPAAGCYVAGFWRTFPEMTTDRRTTVSNRFQQGDGRWWKEMEELDRVKLLRTF
eukprot:g17389.t1